MTTETKILGAIFLLTIVLLFGGIFFLSKGSSPASPQAIGSTAVSQIDYSKGQKIGSDSAKVKLVEFSDFECPACASAESVLKNLRSSYQPDQLQFVYRHYPLPQHKYARQAALLVEAAGEQGKFWEMHDKIFETQSQWAARGDASSFFTDLVKELGLDEAKIKQDMEDPKLKSKVDDDKAEANRLGVNSTPTFYLNGRKLNLNSFADLNTAIEGELKK